MRQSAPAAAAALLWVAALLLALPPPAAAAYSKFWGINGELYDPSKLFDFSFAGYRQGNEAGLPFPNVTRPVDHPEFKQGAKSDTDMLKRALAWAHAQPVVPGSYVVLSLPAGIFTLTERLYIDRSWLVLRGAGSGKTVVSVPKPLYDIYGPNPADERGFYVNQEGFITVRGKYRIGPKLTTVVGTAKKGDNRITVASAAKLKVGDYVQTWWTDVNGAFNNLMFDNQKIAPAKYKGDTRVCYTSKILAISGNVVTLERRLPYDIRAGVNTVTVNGLPSTTQEVGVEGLTFSFAWSWYNGHHLEKGYNALFFTNTVDCWARDIRTINADSAVLAFGCAQLTVTGLQIDVSKTRANNFPNKYGEPADADGHWGVSMAHTFDMLVDGFMTTCKMLHDVGTGSSSKWIVFTRGTMADGNLDLHRALSGPSLYTDIDVGIGTDGIMSGGPPASGPNAAAGTTWWNIRSKLLMPPPHSNANKSPCDFGPVINVVNANIRPNAPVCKTWTIERNVVAPSNLWEAQRARRRAPKMLFGR